MNNNWWAVIDYFYVARNGREVTVGDIVWCPTICWDMNRKILNISRKSTDVDTHDIANVSIEDFSLEKHYKDLDIKRTLPVYKLGLKKSEEFVLDKTKLRPCIVLHCEKEKVQLNGENDTNTNVLNQDMLTLLPIYGFEKNGNIIKYNPKTIHRIKWLQYKKLFFFPADTDSDITKDSFARLDMIFQIPIRHIYRIGRTKLHPDFLSLLKLYILNHFDLGFVKEEYDAEWQTIELAHKYFVDLPD